jgi:hypothetical protein
MHFSAQASVDEGEPGTAMLPIDPPKIAKRLVRNHIDSHYSDPTDLPAYEVYVVLFAYVLGNWKATVATDQPDGKYYEVTYNAAKKEAYVDEYVKVVNVVVNL